ncbi:caspase family protein [Methylobacterium sp. A54F]
MVRMLSARMLSVRLPRGAAVLLLALAALLPAPLPSRAEPAEKRIALVIGNAAYPEGALATTANDAGLVAQTLQAAGFDVAGARDLDEEALRHALRDFVEKAAASGPDTVAFVYLAGYGLQVEGENYFVPVDARIAGAADVPVAALRVSDYVKRLASLPLKARFVVLDAGRRSPFRTKEPLAGGLALAEAEPGSLIAFNAAPGTVGPEETGPYGAYAQALVEMIREGGLAPAALFDRVRLRVDAATKGAEVPWDAARIEAPFVFLERAAGAPPLARPEEAARLAERPLKDIGARDAYAVCLERDTLQGYQDFVSAYPSDPMARRVRAILAARREALTWRRSRLADTPDAYWSYLGRYPRGPHAYDARRRLASLAAALEPPPRYAAIAYEFGPPPPEEIVYVERPAVYFADPVYGLVAPPPLPVVFLPPPPAYIVELTPPPPPVALYALPTPAFVPVPAYVSAPAYVAAPPENVIYQNIHNTTVINAINARNAGVPPAAGLAAGAVAGAALGAAATRVALPPSLARRAGPGQIPVGQAGPGPNPGGQAMPGPAVAGPGQVPMRMGPGPLPPGTAQPQQAARPATVPGAPGLSGSQGVPGGPAVRAGLGQPLPGAGGQPLPPQAGRPADPRTIGRMPPAAAARSVPGGSLTPQIFPSQNPGPQNLAARPGAGAQPLARPATAPPGPDPRLRAAQESRGAQEARAAQEARGAREAQAARAAQMRAAQDSQRAAAQAQAARAHQAIQAQQAVQAAQRAQQMQAAARQQQMMQRQQMVMQQRQQAAPRPMMAPHPQAAPHPPAQHGGGGGGGPHRCPPGVPCR